MQLQVCGINHQTASLQLREKMLFLPENVAAATLQLLELPGCCEVLLLSTCNRTEIYAYASDGMVLRDWLLSQSTGCNKISAQHCYHYRGEVAAHHLFRVICGLDSLCLGEPQIAGQIKAAYATAVRLGAAQRELRRYFQYAFYVAKQVRQQTQIGQHALSLAALSLRIAKQIFQDLSVCKILLIGSGEMVISAARYLQQHGVRKMIFANRTVARAEQLAEEFAGVAVPLSGVSEHLQQVDVVLTAVFSPLPLIGKGSVEQAFTARKRRPLLLLDLAMPRNIEPQCADLEDVYLYCMDDLQQVATQHREERYQDAILAEHLVNQLTREFVVQLRSAPAAGTIRILRKHVRAIEQEELKEAMRLLSLGKDPYLVLQRYSHRLLNKVLHLPTTQIKSQLQAGDGSILETTRNLFGLEEEA